jgi:hypothetical protein
MYLTIFILFLWGIITAVLVRPVWIGIAFVAFAQICLQQLSQYLIFSSSARRDEVKDFIDKIVIRNAWLASKSNFITQLNINSRSDYISYEQWWHRRFHLHNYINCVRGHKVNMFPEDEEFAEHAEEQRTAPVGKEYHR